MKNSHREAVLASEFVESDGSCDILVEFVNPYTASLACQFVKLAAKYLGPWVNDGFVDIRDDSADLRAYSLQMDVFGILTVIIRHSSQGFSCRLSFGGKNGREVDIDSSCTLWPDPKAKELLRFVRRDVKRRFPSKLFSMLRQEPINSLKVGKPRLLAPLEMPPTMAERAEVFCTAILRNFPHEISGWMTWNIIEEAGPHTGFCCACVYANYLPIGFSFQTYSFGAVISCGRETWMCRLCDYDGRIDIVDWDDFCRRIKPRLDAFIPKKYLKIWQQIGTDYRNAAPGAATTLDALLPPLPAAPDADAFLAMLAAGLGPRVSGFETVERTADAFTVFFNAYDHFACRADWRDGRLQTRIVFDRPGEDLTCLVVEACQPWAEIDFSRYVAAVRARLELRLPDRFLAARGWLADNGLFAKIKRLWN